MTAPKCRRVGWWRPAHRFGIVHQDPRSGRWCDESEEQFARRMSQTCAACEKPGHFMCWPSLGPGQSVSFNLPTKENDR